MFHASDSLIISHDPIFASALILEEGGLELSWKSKYRIL